jgi:peptide chain release factor 2
VICVTEYLSLWSVFDVAGKEKEIVDLEKRSSAPDFWTDTSAAKHLMWEMADKKRTIARWRDIEKSVNDTAELASLAAEDTAIKVEVETELDKIVSYLDEMELEAAFTGEFDSRNALLSIHAGAGGTESQDWVGMLMRMYLRWAERRGYASEILDSTPGEEAGMKTVTISISGDYAYGYLKSEHGVHRLVRLSPFDADHARHTSFALVEVMPEAEGGVDVTIGPDDLKIETFRSSGPGGQHMQKSSTAVRITHITSGLVVSSQSERSQHQNKEIAMRILESRLLEKELIRRAEERARIKGKHISAGWGNQIRSYVLHPYKLIKDRRTDYQTGNTESLLDGDLDEFIKAYLRSRVGEE